ncbi:MAG: hypothetical protein RLZZ322_392, partial [Verrucomicrobiota bacterium]
MNTTLPLLAAGVAFLAAQGPALKPADVAP